MKTYPLFKVHVPKMEALARIEEVFDSGFINEGEQVTQLTDGLSRWLGGLDGRLAKLLLTNSCTSALTLALKLSGVDCGSDVVSTPMTCVATNTPIANLGGKIVWADVDPQTGMPSVADVEKAITSRTKAIVVVAWAGTPPGLSELFSFCEAHSIALILDAAHAFGAEYNGVPVHKFARFTCYSFQAIKHFTTGDGGALVCDREDDFKRAKALKWFGLDRDAVKDAKGDWKGQQWDADVVEAGFKFNMNNVAAAIGLAQLPHAKKIVETHRRNAALYDELLRTLAGVLDPVVRPAGGVSSHWVYTVLLRSGQEARDKLLLALNEVGVKAGLVHVPNDGYTAFRASRVDLPGVRQFASQQFSLPCGWWLERRDIHEIVEHVVRLVV